MQMAIHESDEVYMSVYTFDDLEMAVNLAALASKGGKLAIVMDLRIKLRLQVQRAGSS